MKKKFFCFSLILNYLLNIKKKFLFFIYIISFNFNIYNKYYLLNSPMKMKKIILKLLLLFLQKEKYI